MNEAEPTRVDEGLTEVGTQAASPHALGLPSSISARPSSPAMPTTSRPIPTAAAALDDSDMPRMRMFHAFGMIAPLGGIGLSLLIGGDRLAQYLFCAGMLVVSICNIGLFHLAGDPARWKPRPVGILWVIATLGTVPSLYYFGPFSAVVLIQLLGTIFISLGKTRLTALCVVAISVGGQLGLGLPMALQIIDDPGVVSSTFVSPMQLVVAELLILGMLLSGYGLGRWARATNAAALANLENAMRIIGDQQQALVEVKDDAARAKRVDEGRWTGHTMGAWRLGLVLGKGAMGEVYEAAHSDGRAAAVKLLSARADGSANLVERFQREMAVAARLESPHIVRVYEVSPPDAIVPYFAMERLHGIDLATKLRNEPRMPTGELVSMVEQVARGLEVARLAGVVHRDLKPHNVFLHDGTWKILDFGVSKLAGSEGTLTGEGIVGTPQYMAPEQAVGGIVTHLSDVYALGAIAYRCITGRSPFKGNDLAELVYQVVHTPPIRPSVFGRVAPSIEHVLAIAMAKHPKLRFDSALDFAKALVAARAGKPLEIPLPPNAWS